MRFTGVGDHFGTHLSASMVTGLVTTTATAPVDVIKTHMFVGKQTPAIGVLPPSQQHIMNICQSEDTEHYPVQLAYQRALCFSKLPLSQNQCTPEA